MIVRRCMDPALVAFVERGYIAGRSTLRKYQLTVIDDERGPAMPSAHGVFYTFMGP